MCDFDELTFRGANKWVVFGWRTILFTIGFATTAILTVEIIYTSSVVKKYGQQSNDAYIRKLSEHDVRNYVLLIGAVASMWSLIGILYGRVQPHKNVASHLKHNRGNDWMPEVLKK